MNDIIPIEPDRIDTYFGEFMARLAGIDDPALRALFTDLSRALGNQHSCIDLAHLPDGNAVLEQLDALPIVGDGSTNTPLVLEGTRLYMHRYFHYEVRIARALISRNRPVDDIDPAPLAATLAQWFTPEHSDEQRLAALQSLTRQLVIVSGGPGTGKTTTVVKILQALLAMPGPEQQVIRLAAPTGKAAMRLMETVSGADLPVMPEVQTLHRLLGVRDNGRSFRHGPDNPVAANLLVVDEVSMVDLAMMHRLLAALSPETRLILLGDADQLPSVEAGNILADICRYPAGYSAPFAALAADTLDIDVPVAEDEHQLRDAICRLTRSYRFSPDRGIGRLSTRVREGEACDRTSDDQVDTRSLAEIGPDTLTDAYQGYLSQLERAPGDADALMTAFEQARVLSPVREGPFGVTAVNEMIEAALAERGLIDPLQRFYVGRPVLITRNDYNLRLFNGDVGLCLREEGEFKVAFRDPSGSIRSYPASRLPPHETCFAMTVHKSQGSEFDHVLLILPAELTATARHIMTRELVYTAVTRARSRITLFYDGDTLNDCLARHAARDSGLGERFIGAPTPGSTR